MNYFIKNVAAYPKSTVLGLSLYTVLSLFQLIRIEKLSIPISLSAVVGYALMILILKAWVLAFFKGNILKQNPPKFSWSFVMATLIALILSIVALAPMLGQYV